MMSMVSVAFTATVAAQDLEPGDRVEQPRFATLPDGYYYSYDPKCENTGKIDVSAAVYRLTNPCYIVKDGTLDSQTTASYAADNIDVSLGNEINEAHNETVDGDLMDDALAEAQEAYAKALANDSMKSKAQLKADNAATSYIARQMENDLVATNEEFMNRAAGMVVPDGASFSMDYNGTATVEKTLFPDSSASRNITFTGLVDTTDVMYSLFNVGGEDGDRIYSSPTGTDNVSYGNGFFPVTVEYDSSDYSSKDVGSKAMSEKFENTWKNYTATRSAVVDEIDTFSSSLNQSEFENLEPSDVIDRRQAASEWAEKYNSTGNIGYAALLAADNGYSIPGNATTKYMVNLSTTSSVDYTGTLFGAPGAWSATNNSIETGYQYDGSNQTAWVLTLDGTQKDLTEPYTVERIELKDGTMVNQTAMRAPTDGYFANTSSFRENLELYQHLMNESEQLPDDDGGVGVDLDLGDGTTTMVLMVLGGLAVLLIGGGAVALAMRDFVGSDHDDGNFNRRGGY
jgi:hypothetical protein